MAKYSFLLVLSILGRYALASVPPQITAAPNTLEKRALTLSSGISVLWSPTYQGLESTFVSFDLYIASVSFTAYASDSYWGLCARGSTDCGPATACQSTTLFFAGSSRQCASTATLCGTEYLYVTDNTSRESRLTRAVCVRVTDSLSQTIDSFYVASPSAVATPGTSPPVVPQPKSTPVGAIVGGVVGGIAVLVLVILAVFLLLRRRKRRQLLANNGHAYNQPAGGDATVVAAPMATSAYNYNQQPQQQYQQQLYPSPENKHASFVSSTFPSPPPPHYQQQPPPPQHQYSQSSSSTPTGFAGSAASPVSASDSFAPAPIYGGAAPSPGGSTAYTTDAGLGPLHTAYQSAPPGISHEMPAQQVGRPAELGGR